MFVGFISLSMKRRMVERILKGAFTSEFTLEWEGLYPITIKVSILGSLKSIKLESAVRVTVCV